MKAEKNVKGLIKALKYRKDIWYRKEATKALGIIKDPSAIEALISALKDELDQCKPDPNKFLLEPIGEFK